MLTIPLFDDVGRLVAESRDVAEPRPEGIWDMNTQAEIVTVCAWCPDSVERTQLLKARGFNVSHTMCPSCSSRENSKLDIIEGRASR